MRVFSLAARELLDELKADGVKCRAKNSSDLVCECESPFELPPELRQQIKAHKDELLKLLKAGEGNWKPVQWEFRRVKFGQDDWIMGERINPPGKIVAWPIGGATESQSWPDAAALPGRTRQTGAGDPETQSRNEQPRAEPRAGHQFRECLPYRG